MRDQEIRRCKEIRRDGEMELEGGEEIRRSLEQKVRE